MNSVPLADALPWSDDENLSTLTNRMILINDTVETEGRFMMHTLAAQFLSSIGGRVLWLACGPTTDKQVSTALKKIGCDAAAAYLRSLSSVSGMRSAGRAGALKIISLTQEIAIELAGGDDNVGNKESKEDEMTSWNEEEYLKKVCKRAKLWLGKEQKDEPSQRDLIILDDASTLSTILGDTLTYAFIQKLSTLVTLQNTKACLAVRCSNDADVERYITTSESTAAGSGASTSLSSSHAKGSRDWVGAGSNNEELVRIEEDADAMLTKPLPWERRLVEMADGVIDVMPLLSGFSREAHGRIVFSERLGGRGWTSRKSRDLWKRRGGGGSEGAVLSSTSSVVNYRCSDNGVIAFRLRSGS